MSKLAALLGGMTLTDLAKEVLGSQGRGGDTELAHVNKREAALLKSQGGSGTINPETGMREFQDDYFGPEFTQDYSGFAPDQSYMGTPQAGQPVDLTQYGQPTPSAGGGQIGSPPQENFDFTQSAIGGDPYGYIGPVDPNAGFPEAPYQSVTPYIAPGGTTYPGAFAPEFVPDREAEDPYAVDPMEGYRQRNIIDEARSLLAGKPEAAGAPGGGMTTSQRLALAATLGAPQALASRRAGKQAEITRREIQAQGEPLRQLGTDLMQRGQRGEITPVQQQQLAATRAAGRQELVRRGVTSGTAAQQLDLRIQELAQRYAQQNIDEGAKLVNIANSNNLAAIRQAYQETRDAQAMANSYAANLSRIAGGVPETVYVSPTRGTTYG